MEPLSFNRQHRLTSMLCCFIAFLILFLIFSFSARAQTYPTGFKQVQVAAGITNPTVMAFAPDGRIFVAQQTGQLRIIKNGSLLTQPFVSLTVNSAGERGLLGIAFDPGFTSNHFIYLYYTLSSGANNRISRFTANGDVAVAGSELVILNLDPLSSATNHNGGTLEFGPDGKLYVGVGENANGANAQNLDTYLGKILRINADGSVPAGNPFTGSAQRSRVWAYGMRNPYTITFQRGTGKLFVNDVGENTWEEINDVTTGGHNYGWPGAEGQSSDPNFTNPVYYYHHGTGPGLGCAITGGTFFNPVTTNYPSKYIGKYFFIDYCGNWIDTLTLSTGHASDFASTVAGAPVSILTGDDGNLYFLSRTNSGVYKVTYTPGSVTTTVNPVADAFVRSGSFAATNYGTNKKLDTKNATTANNTYQTYLRFDISSISTNATSVKLRLYGHLKNTNTAAITVQVFNVTTNTWQESTINYNNKPAAQATVLASSTVSGTVNQYYEWDLTSFILGLRNSGTTLVSLLAKNSTVSNSDMAIFNSKEAGGNKPQLMISTPAARSAGKIKQPEDRPVPVPAFSFSVYPNPATNSVTLQYPVEFQKSKLQVVDISGRIVKELLLSNPFSQTIMLDNLQTGMYILFVECNGKKYSQKLLVRK